MRARAVARVILCRANVVFEKFAIKLVEHGDNRGRRVEQKDWLRCAHFRLVTHLMFRREVSNMIAVSLRQIGIGRTRN